jgi:hypothetical protein
MQQAYQRRERLSRFPGQGDPIKGVVRRFRTGAERFRVVVTE